MVADLRDIRDVEEIKQAEDFNFFFLGEGGVLKKKFCNKKLTDFFFWGSINFSNLISFKRKIILGNKYRQAKAVAAAEKKTQMQISDSEIFFYQKAIQGFGDIRFW